ncbi:MAG: hypothetical protein WC123_07635 [Bacilli bacterium]
MYKNYLLITENYTRFYSTEEELLTEVKAIENHNNNEKIIENDRIIKIIFAGKVNIEQVYDDTRKKLVFV